MKLKIKELAAEKGVELQEVAKAIGVRPSAISNMIKTGRTTAEKMEALCLYFGVSPNELIVLDDEDCEKSYSSYPKGFLTKKFSDVGFDVNTILENISALPPRKQKPLIEAMQKMVEVALR